MNVLTRSGLMHRSGIGGIALVMSLAAMPASGDPGETLPVQVREAIAELPRHGAKAKIVRSDGDPWIVAMANGKPRDDVVPGMERDNAIRAAVEVAKNEAAKLLAANVAVFVTDARSGPNAGSFSREVVVTVAGQVLAGTQLYDAQYEPATGDARAVILCPPPDGTRTASAVFANTTTAATSLLERASMGLCGTGVICVPVSQNADNVKRIVPIAVTAAPGRGPVGQRIGTAKGLAALQRFLAERIDSRETLRQETSVVPDPFTASGSQMIYKEEFKRTTEVKQNGIVPPTMGLHREANGVLYTATWFVD